MANETVGININVKTNVEGSIGQLKALKKQLKDTAAGSDEFKKLTGQIDDLEDKLKGSKQAAGDWVDQLASAPGPLGAVGNAINRAKVATVSFGSALKATGIGLVVTLIGGLVAAFAQSERATKKLQPLLEGFERIFNGIFAAIEPVFNLLVDLAIKAMPFVTNAIGAAYSAVTSFIQGLGSLASAVGKLLEGDFSGAWDSAKEAVTGFGKRYDEANKRFIAGTKEVTKNEKEELDKRKELAKKAAEEREKANEEILKKAIEYSNEILLLETKSEKERAEIKLALQYEADKKSIEQSKASAILKQQALKTLDVKFNLDKKALDDEFNKKDQEREKQFQDNLNNLKTEIRLNGIKDSRQKERELLDLELQKDIEKITNDETLKEDAKAQLIEQLRIRNKQKSNDLDDKFQKEDVQKNFDRLNSIIQNNDLELEQRRNAIQQERELNEQLFRDKKITEEEYLKRKKELGDAEKAIDKEVADNKKQQATEAADRLSQLADLVGKQTIAGKALGIATALINTYQGASEAIKQRSTLPSPFDVISKVVNVASIIATGLKTVKAITAVQIPSVGGKSGGGGASPSIPSVSATAPPISPIQNLEASSTLLNAQAIQQLGSATNRAYVVESDVTNSQERIKRINRAARLS